MNGIPREVLLWLQALNLTYKIRNPKRDLANGFVIAEVLSRYQLSYFDKRQETNLKLTVSTQSFDTGFGMPARKANWALLRKIFTRLESEELVVTDKEIDSILNCDPDAALNLLLKLYAHLTGKTPDGISHPSNVEQNMPDYAKPTIFQKLKDRQFMRLVDKRKIAQRAEEIITTHDEDMQNLRLTRVDRFTKPKRRIIRDEDPTKDMCEARRKRMAAKMSEMSGDEQDGKDAKEVKVRAAGGKELAKAKMSRRAALTSQEEETVVITFDAVLNDVINSVLSAKMEREDKDDMQEYKEYEDKRGLFLIKHFADRDPADVEQIFTVMSDRSEEFAKAFATNAVDFSAYMSFIVQLFQQMQPFTEPFARIYTRSLFLVGFLSVITEIGNKLLNLDPHISELYFLEYGLPALAPLLVSNPAKCNELVILLACYVPATSNAYARLIQAMKVNLRPFDSFVYCLAKLLSFGSVEIDETLYVVCFRHAVDGFQAASPVTRTKALSILGILGQYDFRPILQVLGIIDKLSAEYYWESRAQIIMLCANMLESLNQLSIAKAEAKKEMETIKEEEEKKGGESQREGKANSTHNESKAEDRSPVQKVETKKAEIPAAVDEEKKADEPSGIAPQEEPKDDDENYADAEKAIFDILHKVFNDSTPIIAQKIGLIYTAKLLRYYKEFSKHYLQILLKVPEKVRANVLDVKPMPGTEEEVYVLGVYTQKYRTFGAPLEWQSLYVASELESFIRSNDLKFLEQVHIQVFESCLVQEFAPHEIEEWLTIFQNLKRYFFIALCDRELCFASIQILKKFFCHAKMQAFVLENTKEVFVKTLTLLYNPDRDQECRERNKDFLEFLHDFDENNVALRDFVYTIIKSFASVSRKAYEESNLILLMNRIVEERRGDIFQHEGDEAEKGTSGGENGQAAAV